MTVARGTRIHSMWRTRKVAQARLLRVPVVSMMLAVFVRVSKFRGGSVERASLNTQRSLYIAPHKIYEYVCVCTYVNLYF